MPIDPPAGYLTRPEAAKLYNRSQRALERDLDTALRVGDRDVLSHFRLVTKDGEIRQAPEVTIEEVKELVSEGMTPVWYVEEPWLLETYGRKGEPKPQPAQPSAATTRPGDSTDGDGGSIVEPASAPAPSTSQGIDLSGMYRDQLREKQEEIRQLRRELDIKNEQIRDANERTRESNVLMKELQKMLGSWQDRAFQSLPAAPQPTEPQRPPVASVSTTPASVSEAANTPDSKSAGSRPTTTKKASGKRRNKSQKRKTTKTKKKQAPLETAAKKYLPTLTRFLGR